MWMPSTVLTTQSTPPLSSETDVCFPRFPDARPDVSSAAIALPPGGGAGPSLPGGSPAWDPLVGSADENPQLERAHLYREMRMELKADRLEREKASKKKRIFGLSGGH